MKALAWVFDRFPAIAAFGFAVWCIADDRPELGMGFLILAGLSELMRLLIEIRDELKAKADR